MDLLTHKVLYSFLFKSIIFAPISWGGGCWCSILRPCTKVDDAVASRIRHEPGSCCAWRNLFGEVWNLSWFVVSFVDSSSSRRIWRRELRSHQWPRRQQSRLTPRLFHPHALRVFRCLCNKCRGSIPLCRVSMRPCYHQCEFRKNSLNLSKMTLGQFLVYSDQHNVS